MMGNRSKLKNFVEKFIETVRFGNDHFGAIMGYGDYVIGDSVILRVYYVEGLGHNLFSVRQFCDSDLEDSLQKAILGFVRDINGADLLKGIRSTNLYTISIDDMMKSSPICLLPKASKCPTKLEVFEKIIFAQPVTLKKQEVGLNKTVRYIRTDNGTEFVNQVMSEYYEGVGVFHQKSVPRTPQQNGVVERRNRTLVEAARTMMIFSKAPMFLWAEAVATACYTQNRSLIHTRHNKTPYELVHDKKPDLTFLRVFGALCYPINDSEDLGKFQAKADIGEIDRWTMAPVRMSSGPEPIIMTPGQLKSGLAPTDKELEMLFQPMFDEYLEQSRVNEPVPSATAVNAQVVPPGTSLSTTIAQRRPSYKCFISHRYAIIQSASSHAREITIFPEIDLKYVEFQYLTINSAPIYVKVIALKWIYKVKLDEYGDKSVSSDLKKDLKTMNNPNSRYRLKNALMSKAGTKGLLTRPRFRGMVGTLMYRLQASKTRPYSLIAGHQRSTVISTTEAEYIAMDLDVVLKSLWMRSTSIKD
ncbi:integrase, catalytic region, zinc finger, CCHC-type containing protein [Tanacetum coccineum]